MRELRANDIFRYPVISDVGSPNTGKVEFSIIYRGVGSPIKYRMKRILQVSFLTTDNQLLPSRCEWLTVSESDEVVA